jgi:branched-chain amino acid transport system permease protein
VLSSVLKYRLLLIRTVSVILIGLLVYDVAPYTNYALGQLAAIIIIAVGLNLITGVAGLLSLASAAFVGVGATATASLMINAHLNVIPALLIATAMGVVCGYALGAASLRLSGFYLAIVTLGFLEAVVTVLQSSGSWGGGGYGLIVPDASLPGIGELTVQIYSAASAALCLVVIFIASNLTMSRTGRAWIAAKDRSTVAALQGINVARTRTAAFCISSGIIAFGGGLQTLALGITSPTAYGSDVSVQHVSYVVVGGMSPGSIGPVAGPALLFGIPEFTQALGKWETLVYGLVMLAVILCAPRGIAGLVETAKRRAVSAWTRRSKAAEA